MANRERLYFYAPTWDSLPDGPIRLGNVMTSVKKPDRPLACNPPPNDSDVFRTEKRSVRYTQEKLRSGQFSVLTKFLSFLGFGVDVGLDFRHREEAATDEETFVFKTVETAQFVPTPSYLQACVESDDVRRYLQLSKYRKPVYVITGVKVVTGAEAHTLRARSVGGSHALEVDGTVWSGGGASVAVGPGLKGRVGRTALSQWEGASDFVFAFRVTELRVDKTTAQVRSETEYREGAMLGDEGDEPPACGPELSVLEAQDLYAENEDFDLYELREGADVVLCAVPK